MATCNRDRPLMEYTFHPRMSFALCNQLFSVIQMSVQRNDAIEPRPQTKKVTQIKLGRPKME